jgi:radical SAM protein with 4Fe4S-binding SPASM domain
VIKEAVEHPFLNPSVILREESFGGLAYTQDRSCVYELDPTACAILKLCTGQSTLEEIWGQVQTRNINVELNELEAFVAEMSREGILNAEDGLTSGGSDPHIYSYISARQYPHLKAPIMVNWEITRSCNLRCLHCYNGSGKPLRSELSTSEAKRVLEDLKSCEVIWVAVTGGEPFMRPDLFEILEYARMIGLSVLLSSNGTLIDAARAARLAELKLEGIQISLDGPDPKTHDFQRGTKGAFERALLGLQLLRDAGVRGLTVATVATSANYRTVPDVLQVAIEYGAQGFRVMNLVPGVGTERNPGLFLTPFQRQWLYAAVKEGEQRFAKDLNVFDETPAGYLARGCVPDVPDDLHLPLGCPAGRSVAKISPDGFLFPCTFFTNQDSRIGDLRAERLHDCWNKETPVLATLRHLDHLTGHCGACTFLRICGGGCRACAYNYFGQLNASDPTCYINHD